MDAVLQWEMTALHAWEPLREGAETEFLRALGFRSLRRRWHYQLEIHHLVAALNPLLSRLQEQGRVPGGARVIPVRDAPLQAVLDLYRRYLGGTPQALRSRLMGAGAECMSADDSLALMVGSQLAGILVGGWEAEGGRIDGYVLEPAYRGRWASVLLLVSLAQRALGKGVTTCRFFCYDNVTGTMKLATRCQARVEKVDAYYALEIGASDVGPGVPPEPFEGGEPG